MAEMTEEELLDLKKEIDEAKAKVSELTGKQKYLKKQLLEWQCKNMKEAVEKLENMRAEMEKLAKEINERIERIKTQYNV